VGGKAEIFKHMPDENAQHMSTVYVKAEELFTRLWKQAKEYAPWTALA